MVRKKVNEFKETMKEVKNPWQFILALFHMIFKWKKLKEFLLLINVILLIYIIIGNERLSKIPIIGKIFKSEKINVLQK